MLRSIYKWKQDLLTATGEAKIGKIVQCANILLCGNDIQNHETRRRQQQTQLLVKNFFSTNSRPWVFVLFFYSQTAVLLALFFLATGHQFVCNGWLSAIIYLRTRFLSFAILFRNIHCARNGFREVGCLHSSFN